MKRRYCIAPPLSIPNEEVPHAKQNQRPYTIRAQGFTTQSEENGEDYEKYLFHSGLPSLSRQKRRKDKAHNRHASKDSEANRDKGESICILLHNGNGEQIMPNAIYQVIELCAFGYHFLHFLSPLFLNRIRRKSGASSSAMSYLLFKV